MAPFKKNLPSLFTHLSAFCGEITVEVKYRASLDDKINTYGVNLNKKGQPSSGKPVS